ncbi:MAG: GAF domain-containing protein [Chloroflexi bacterium]|nr:GAF domain-containing protein [Chloroflexota bacterium]
MNGHLPRCADPDTLEAIPAGVCLLDTRDFRVVAHNRLYQSLLAEPYRTEGVVGLRIADYIPGFEQAGMFDCLRQVAGTRQPCISRPCVAREFPYHGSAPGLSYWDIHIAPIQDERGEVGWELVTVWEVTERVLAEQRLHTALQELHHQLSFTRAITGSLGEGVFALDRQGRLTFLNPAAEQMLGWTEAELLGKDMHEVIHFQRADGTPFPAEECLLRAVTDSGMTIRNDDDVFTRKDGTMFPVTCTSAPIVADGRVTGAVLAFRDSTEQVRARRRLEVVAAEERRLRSVADVLLSVTEAGLAATDLDKLLTSVLTRTVAVFGARAGVVLLVDETGKRLVVRNAVGIPEERAFALPIGEGFPGRIAATGRPLAVRDAQRAEWALSPCIQAHGIRAMLGVPLVSEGATLGVLHVDFLEERDFRDDEVRLLQAVAERTALLVANVRLRAEAEHRAEEMAEFLHLIAHDVRQPLTIVRGQAQLLRRALDRGNQQHARSSAETIDVATRRLEAMVGDLVDSARLEMGQFQFHREQIEVTAFISDLIPRLAAALDVDRVRAVMTTPVVACADPNRLERILGNLLSNALKYSDPATEVTVTVEERAGEALVTVADRGAGIAPADLPRLFERGFRAEHAASRAEGLGLGLYITRLLVEAHGGHIWVESELGQGSTFRFTLPRSCRRPSDVRGMAA